MYCCCVILPRGNRAVIYFGKRVMVAEELPVSLSNNKKQTGIFIATLLPSLPAFAQSTTTSVHPLPPTEVALSGGRAANTHRKPRHHPQLPDRMIALSKIKLSYVPGIYEYTGWVVLSLILTSRPELSEAGR